MTPSERAQALIRWILDRPEQFITGGTTGIQRLHDVITGAITEAEARGRSDGAVYRCNACYESGRAAGLEEAEALCLSHARTRPTTPGGQLLAKECAAMIRMEMEKGPLGTEPVKKGTV